MRFSEFLVGVFVAATAIVASPTQSPDLAQVPFGNVVDANMTAYMLHYTEPGNIRIITQKANGEFMKPVSFHIRQCYACKFYSESTRGVGYLIGEYHGPLNGTFGKHWAAFYECWSIAEQTFPKAPINAVKPRDTAHDTQAMIPCGYVRTSTGGRQSLIESGKGLIVHFAINGEPYTPTFYHVSRSCTCIFYSNLAVRGGDVPIAEANGPAEGNFSNPKATRYKCWLRI